MTNFVARRFQAPLVVAGTVGFLWLLPLVHGHPEIKLSGHDFERAAQTILLMLAAVSLVFSRTPGVSLFLGRPWRKPFQWALLALVATSVYLSALPAIACRELALFLGLLQFSRFLSPYLVADTVRQSLLRGLSAAALFYGVAVMVILIGAVNSGPIYDAWDLLIGFDNPRFLNHAQTIALPLVAIAAAEQEDRFWRRVGWATLVVSGILLVITYGRATVLGLLIGSLAALVLFRRQSLHYLSRAFVPTFVGALIGWALYTLYLRPAGFGIQTGEFTKIHMRDYLVHEALGLWRESPWFGVGPMHFAHWYNGEAAHPHNFYMQLLCEYGAPAAVMVGAGIATWVYRAIRTMLQARAQDPSQYASQCLSLSVGLTVAVVAVVVDSAFSGNFVMPVSQTWIAVLIAIVAAVRERQEPRETGQAAVQRSPTIKRLGPVLCAAVLGWLLWVTWQDLHGTSRVVLPTDGPLNASPELKKSVNPRYWTVGWF